MIERLKHVLNQEDAVLFIGSGISMWSGLPTWYGLIESLAKFIEEQGYSADLVRSEAGKDLLQAASYGFDKLTSQQIGDFIRKASLYGKAQPHEIHKKIIKLGPRCFITTNYDNLIEEGLRRWEPDRFFRTVTNRHLPEIAEVVQARALDFVFKPHGDAGDSDSIVLTREQYRRLLPDGDRHNALESVKMLLASRPVIYCGFGLRDPDFLYVKDLLANTYKGGNRDHYAIMADVTEAEVDYWRRHYGVHLVSYETRERADGHKDHSGLLELLDQLLPSVSVPLTVPNSHSTPDTGLLLSLTRHAARLMRVPKVSPEFPLRVNNVNEASVKQHDSFRMGRFSHWPIAKFLDEGPNRAVIIGSPGTGKSYAFKQAASRLAERLHETCLMEQCQKEKIVIPIFVDLKVYGGDIWSLIEKTLPIDLPLQLLVEQFKIKFLLDSFNEIPREYLESGEYENDLSKFIEKIGDSSVLISSRTTDGLKSIKFPFYSLDQIDINFVQKELDRLGINVEGRFKTDIHRLLQKPFYFQLVVNKTVFISEDTHPKYIFQSFFLNASNEFKNHFHTTLDLEKVLSLNGYESLNRGQEALPLVSFVQVLKNQLQVENMLVISPDEIINWLVSKGILIPYSGAKLSFFHQSVTEFLAAKELARRYHDTPYILKEKLALRRWDQSLFLTMSLLQSDEAQTFLREIMDVDLQLALNAVRFLEFDRDEAVKSILDEVLIRLDANQISDFTFSWQLGSVLPVNDTHENQLREVIKYGNAIGAAAAARLIELKGVTIKEDILSSICEKCTDYNYCSSVGRAICSYIEESDVYKLLDFADHLENQIDNVVLKKGEHPYLAFITGIQECTSLLDLSFLASVFSDPEDKSITIRSYILCDILQERTSTQSLELAASLLLRDMADASFAIDMVASRKDSKSLLSWKIFNSKHADKIMSFLSGPQGRWALSALVILCQRRVDLKDYIVNVAQKETGLLHALLTYATDTSKHTLVFEALQGLAITNHDDLYAHILAGIDLDWRGNEQLFVQLLRSSSETLMYHLLESQYPNSSLGQLEIGPVEWWLNRLESITSNDRNSIWIEYRLSHLFGSHLSNEEQGAFLAEFNKKNSPYRRILVRSILPEQQGLTTDDFSEDAISFLLASLSGQVVKRSFKGHLLSTTATEKFVTEQLIPLLTYSTGILKDNLSEILQQAGARHGRRYIEI